MSIACPRTAGRTASGMLKTPPRTSTRTRADLCQQIGASARRTSADDWDGQDEWTWRWRRNRRRPADTWTDRSHTPPPADWQRRNHSCGRIDRQRDWVRGSARGRSPHWSRRTRWCRCWCTTKTDESSFSSASSATCLRSSSCRRWRSSRECPKSAARWKWTLRKTKWRCMWEKRRVCYFAK